MLPQTYNLDKGYSHFEKLGYISATSLFSELLASPFERAKTKIQTKVPSVSPGLFHLNELAYYIRDISSKEGLTKIFYGLRASLDREVIFNISRFYGYYLSMKYICDNKNYEQKPLDMAFSCILGTSLGSLLGQPSEVLRLKMQSESIGATEEKKIGGLLKSKQIIKLNKNPNIMLSGLSIKLLAHNTQTLLELFSFLSIKDRIIKTNKFQSEYTANGVAIIIASALGALVSTPLDLIHTRVVLRTISQKSTPTILYLYHNLKTEGMLGLYKTYIPHFYRLAMFNLSAGTIFGLMGVNSQNEHRFGEVSAVENVPNYNANTDQFRQEPQISNNNYGDQRSL